MPKPNTKLTWVNCMHIYQPPWQQDEVVHAVTKESYLWIVEKLKQFPNLRLTLNVAGTLLETFERLGYQQIITDLRKLLRSGQIELTGSSHFHAFLPELPDAEIIHQIELQEDALAKYFDGYKPKGFFPPELAYNARIGAIVKKRGYAWIMLDPMSMDEPFADGINYKDAASGVSVVFRNRTISKTFPPETLFKFAKQGARKDRTIITATDGELYGHFHKDWQDHLKQIMESSLVDSEQVSQYLARLTMEKRIKLHPASWETRSKQLKKNNPFSIWYNKENPIHHDLWALAHYAIQLLVKHAKDPNYAWARHHLDRGLASCSWWWASEVKTSPLAPLAWNPDKIERGSLELIKAIRSLNLASAREKLRGEHLHLRLIDNIWSRHWKHYGKHTQSR